MENSDERNRVASPRQCVLMGMAHLTGVVQFSLFELVRIPAFECLEDSAVDVDIGTVS